MMTKYIRPLTDEELLEHYPSEIDLLMGLLPGNYVPTHEQAIEIAHEIIRALDRYRQLKKERS